MVARNNNDTVRTVNVARIPGTFVAVGVQANMTVGQALSAAGITLQRNEQVRANGETVSVNDVINGYTTITVTQNIKGNK